MSTLLADQVNRATPEQQRMISSLLEDKYDQFLEALFAPEMLSKLSAADPLVSARLRGLQAKRQLLSGEGEPLSSSDVGNILGISRQAVDKRRSQGQLIAVTLGKRRGYAYPLFQFVDGQVISGLVEVLTALISKDGWSQILFFLTGDIQLQGDRPIDQLKQGNIDAVVSAATNYGRQTAA